MHTSSALRADRDKYTAQYPVISSIDEFPFYGSHPYKYFLHCFRNPAVIPSKDVETNFSGDLVSVAILYLVTNNLYSCLGLQRHWSGAEQQQLEFRKEHEASSGNSSNLAVTCLKLD